jgi:tryptophan-rich sensory protein
VNQVLSTIVTITALALAAWAFLGAARNRPPDLIQGIGLALVQLATLILAVVAVVAWTRGPGPREAATFGGYLLTMVLLPIAAYLMARLETTRWGSVIIGGAAIIIPVLILRLDQLWA